MNSLFIVLAVILLVSGVLFLQNKPESEGQPNTNTQTERSETDIEAEVKDVDEVEEIQEEKSANTLDLSDQNLTQVPAYVFGRTDIEVLDLSHNSLSGALQAEVRHLQKLKVLDLSDNNFTGVPAEVGQLSRLEILNLSSNPLTGLPYEIGNLKNLKVLDLRGTNYAEADLSVIRASLPADVEIKTE